MNNDDINKSIFQQKLPLEGSDYLILALCIFLSSMIVTVTVIEYAESENSFFYSSLQSLAILLFLFMPAFMTWKIFHEKELVIVPSKLSLDKKHVAIENLTHDGNTKNVIQQDQYFRLSRVESEWGAYTVILIYNNTAFGINSIQGSGRSSSLSNDISASISKKLQAFESHSVT